MKAKEMSFRQCLSLLAVFLALILLLVLVNELSASIPVIRTSQSDFDRWYWNWWTSGGRELMEAKAEQQQKAQELKAEYDFVHNLNRAIQLTVEIHELDISLNQLLIQKGELYTQKLSDQRVEVAIKKLVTELKGKVHDLEQSTK